jgi:hypothetical protein
MPDKKPDPRVPIRYLEGEAARRYLAESLIFSLVGPALKRPTE